jgi:hypothetical protein
MRGSCSRSDLLARPTDESPLKTATCCLSQSSCWRFLLSRFPWQYPRSRSRSDAIEKLKLCIGATVHPRYPALLSQVPQIPPDIDALDDTDGIRFLRKHYTDPITGKEDWQPGGAVGNSAAGSAGGTTAFPAGTTPTAPNGPWGPNGNLPSPSPPSPSPPPPPTSGPWGPNGNLPSPSQ